MKTKEIEDVIDKMEKDWPSTIVTRTAIWKFTGGTISRGTMANLDSLGKGPTSSFKMNGKVCYHTSDLCDWLKNRARNLKLHVSNFREE
jgi:hypothetical protein